MGDGTVTSTQFYLLAGEQGSNPMQFLFLIGGMILIMYFVMFRPQMKEQKRRRAMLAAIKKHDQVLTSGGVYGTVVSVSEAEVVLKIDDNVRVKFARSAVTAIVNRNDDEDDTSS